MATGRSYAQISSYAEAGIDRYRILAVMDAHTTPLCRFLNGKTFSVATALDRFDAIDALEDPEQIKAALPWGRQARDRETGEMHIYVERDGARTTVASYPPGRRDAHSRARRRRGARRHLGVPAVPRPLSLGDGRSFLKSGIPHRSGEAKVPLARSSEEQASRARFQSERVTKNPAPPATPTRFRARAARHTFRNGSVPRGERR